MLAVMDLGLRLEQPPRAYQLHDHVIVLEQEGRLFGMLVNEVHGVHEIALEALETPSAFTESYARGCRFVRHLVKLDDAPIMVLDHDRLLATAEEPPAEATLGTWAMCDVRWHQSPEYGPGHDAIPTNPPETIPRFFQHAAAWEREILL